MTYDAIGNMLKHYTGFTFEWQNGRQLAGVTGNNQIISYTYNADGIRTSKTVNGVTTYYTLEGSNVVMETNGTDTIWYYYDATGSLTGFELNGTAYFYVKNLQGDIIAIINSSGTKVVEYVYDSWGKLISTTGSLASTVGVKNPYRYRGYRYDTETGLYYLQSRYYDPLAKRFVNADGYVSTGQGVLGNNMFAYCLNNPACYVDSNGKSAALAWWASTMWWLCGVDSILPIGDIIYISGLTVLGICAVIIVSEAEIPDVPILTSGNISDDNKDEVTKDNPPTESDGYIAPKGGAKKGKTKDGQTGWVDKYGNVWVPAPTGSAVAHGGGHWDVVRGDGKGYTNVYPGGKTRTGRGKSPHIPHISHTLD